MKQSRIISSIQSLKKEAKKIAHHRQLPLGHAQNIVAKAHGFTHWALLMKYFNSMKLSSAESIWASINPSELMLLSAPEGAGKLSMALNLVHHALEEGFQVKYYAIHFDRKVIIDRLNTIIGEEFSNKLIELSRFEVIDQIINERELLQSLQKTGEETFVIIDFLQAINCESDEPHEYDSLLLGMKNLVKKQAWRGLILSQVTSREEASLARYCNHILKLERNEKIPHESRELSLVKSTHYQKRENQLLFDPVTYRFLEQ